MNYVKEKTINIVILQVYRHGYTAVPKQPKLIEAEEVITIRSLYLIKEKKGRQNKSNKFETANN